MPEQSPEPLLLGPSEVRRLLAGGETVIVLDARGRAAFARSGERVAGDVRAPGTRDLAWAAGLPRDAALLAYCTCLDDGLAVRVAARLREAGFPRAYAVRGGLEGCRATGLEVVRR
jgi:rhodanese-related sulfurtransferase